MDATLGVDAVKVQLGALCEGLAERRGCSRQGHRLAQHDAGLGDPLLRPSCVAQGQQEEADQGLSY